MNPFLEARSSRAGLTSGVVGTGLGPGSAQVVLKPGSVGASVALEPIRMVLDTSSAGAWGGRSHPGV
jgi:hypothetical protein